MKLCQRAPLGAATVFLGLLVGCSSTSDLNQRAASVQQRANQEIRRMEQQAGTALPAPAVPGPATGLPAPQTPVAPTPVAMPPAATSPGAGMATATVPKPPSPPAATAAAPTAPVPQAPHLQQAMAPLRQEAGGPVALPASAPKPVAPSVATPALGPTPTLPLAAAASPSTPAPGPATGADSVVAVDDQIRFARGQTRLDAPVRQALVALADRLKAQPVSLEIVGLANDGGSPERNQALGLARAQAVRDVLYTAGVPLHRLQVISLGAEPLPAGFLPAGPAAAAPAKPATALPPLPKNKKARAKELARRKAAALAARDGADSSGRRVVLRMIR